MKVELIAGTPEPERLVCTAARNDYREDGIIGYSYDDIMDSRKVERGDPDVAWLKDNDWFADRFDHGVTAIRTKKLIDHLMKSDHWGPFEHPQATVAIEGVTRVVTHQIVRHRHFTYDQQSLRYVHVEPGPDTFYTPMMKGEDFDVDREGVHEIGDPVDIERTYDEAYADSSGFYQELRDLGVPKEKARMVLPMGIKTNIVMSGSARAWMHILNVRTKANVQGQTRECAEAIFDELKEWMPYTFQKYDEDVLPLRLNP